MIQALLLSTILTSACPAPVPSFCASATRFQDSIDEEGAKKKIDAAGDDVAALEALAEQWKEAGERDFARLAFERVLRVDPENVTAHEGLRHHLYEGTWYTSYAALSKYKREQTKEMKEKGLLRFGDDWVPEADLPYLRMGWTKVGETFQSPATLGRQKQREEFAAKGYQQRAEDSSWVSPDDFDKWKEGLFSVDGDWVSGADADAYHGSIKNAWRYRGKHFVAYTTCDHITAASVAWWADKTYDSLVRLFGVVPEEPPVFACLKSLEQYNTFAAGSQDEGLPTTETGGFSSFHFAFRGDTWFFPAPPDAPQAFEYIGGGVAFNDINDPSLKPWGPYAVRHAAGLSFAESIDHAWSTISDLLSGNGNGAQPDQLWSEKRIPRWLFYGGASYVERFYRDMDAEQAGNDPWGVRSWAIGQIAAGGDLDAVEDLFQMRLDLADAAGSGRRIEEVGLLTAFVMDGGCKPVEKAHGVFTQAMASGADTTEAVAGLESAILDHQKELEEFTGMKIAAPAATEAGTTEAGSGG